MLVNLICFLAILFSANVSWAQANIIRPDVIETKFVESNYIKNPSALKNMANITTSSATATRDTSAGNKIEGIASTSCDTSALNGYCEWSTNTIKTPDDSGNCAAYAEVKGDASLYRLIAVVGGVEVNQSAIIGNQASFKPVTVNVPCGATASVRLKQTEAGTSAAINAGRVSWGRATNLGQFMAGAQYVGSFTMAPATNCIFTTNTTFSNYAADPDCNLPTVTGSLVAPGTRTLSFSANTLPGNYLFVASGLFLTANASQTVAYRISDGTTSSTPSSLYVPTSFNSTSTIVGNIEYTSPGLRTFNFQGEGSGSVTTSVDITGTNRNFKIQVYYFPDASLQAIRADQTSFGLSDSGPVTITATTTNPTKGTTSRDKLWFSREGQYLVGRVEFTQTGAGSAGSGDYLFTIPSICTPDTSIVSAYSTLEGSAGAFAVRNIIGWGAASDGTNNAVLINTLYDTTKMRLFYWSGAQASSVGIGAIGSGFYPTSSAALSYAFDFKIPCVGWISNQSAPQLVNSVISSYAGVAAEEWAVVSTSCTSSPCTIASQSGGFTSITRSGTGSYQANLAKSYLAFPYCSVQIIGPGNYAANLGSQSVSQANWNITNATTATNTDSAFSISCKGPR